MTKKQAKEWVSKNCVFAMNQDVLGMVKEAATQKGVKLTEEQQAFYAARALVMASLEKEAQSDYPSQEEIDQAVMAVLKSNPTATPYQVTNTVVDNLLKTKGADPFANRPVYFRQILPRAKELISGLSKDELAQLHLREPGRVGPNPPPPERARLSQPPLPRGNVPLPSTL